VTIPNSVTVIGSYSFKGCTGLTSVTIGNSVTVIAGEAFSNCSNLTSITIPASVTDIRGKAFTGCEKLTSVTIQGTSEKFRGDWGRSSFSSDAFIGDLHEKFLASDGGPGIYTRFANGSTWRKQAN
jgi:hypothetical protein